MAGIGQFQMAVDFPAALGERLSLTELPRGTDFDQQLLRELPTSQPVMETEPSAM
jgi:hypothetical protein